MSKRNEFSKPVTDNGRHHPKWIVCRPRSFSSFDLGMGMVSWTALSLECLMELGVSCPDEPLLVKVELVVAIHHAVTASIYAAWEPIQFTIT